MEKFNNIKTFVNNLEKCRELDDDLIKLIWFTSWAKFYRQVGNRMPFVNKVTKIINNGDNYILKYKRKDIPFSLLSDRGLQEYDKEILKNIKNRSSEELGRTLKLACSMDLVNPRVAIGNSSLGYLRLLILFQENGIDKVIDYSSNLVMSKSDYYELFDFKEINVVNKFDLYNIYYILDSLGLVASIYEYLIFSKEIFRELSKKEDFSFLGKKYDEKGMNYHNYVLFGNKFDCLFFQKADCENPKYLEIRRELDEFTKNPSELKKHIKYDKTMDKYILKEREFGYFTFDLLSDIVIGSEELKEELLSDNRYGKCHQNSNFIANSLIKNCRDSVYVVGGKIKVNDVDYFYHSWVEIDDKNVVIDFNHNVVMNRDKYYKLYGAVAISKTKGLDIVDIRQTVIFDADFNIHDMYINYFGKEIAQDLKKNAVLFRKK